MTHNLSKLPIDELLQKFGAGGHKPGSGSAAALLGLISCALAKTVIGLSKDRDNYKNARVELISIEIYITEEIEPVLWKAFEDDSIQFDKVIKARRARDDAKEPKEHRLCAREALNTLHSATEILLIIAEKCLLLAEKAVSVFDKGFQDARGDSGVAISSALSGATGAISIIYCPSLGGLKPSPSGESFSKIFCTIQSS